MVRDGLPLFLSSGDLIADRRYEWGLALAARGDLAGAVDLLQQAAEATPGFASAWFALGDLHERRGDPRSAAAAFARACEADPDDRHGATLRLARFGVADASDAMSEGYVRSLFDQYAPAFETAVVDGLRYRGPALLREAIAAACAHRQRALRFARMLDLGCGTGLVSGKRLRTCAERWSASIFRRQ